MGAKSPKTGHELTREDNSRGGKKSKRGVSWRTLFDNLMGETPPAEVKADLLAKGVRIPEGTWNKAISQAIAAKAVQGDTAAAKLLIETMDGKPKEHHTHATDPDNPPNIIIKWPEGEK